MQSFREGNAAEGQYRRDDDDEGGEVEQEAVDVVDVDDFLGQHFDHVGDTLYDAVGAHAVRSDTALEEGAHFTFHVDQHEGDHGVSHEQAKPDEDEFDQRGGRVWEEAP